MMYGEENKYEKRAQNRETHYQKSHILYLTMNQLERDGEPGRSACGKLLSAVNSSGLGCCDGDVEVLKNGIFSCGWFVMFIAGDRLVFCPVVWS